MPSEQLRSELNQLLSEEVGSAQKRETSTFNEMATPFSDSLVLFGAGLLGRKTLTGLRSIGVEPLAFADNNRAVWGKEIDGLKVLSPADAAGQFGDRAAFVVTIWTGSGTERMSTRCRQLTSLGCARVIPFAFLYWKYDEVFLPHWAVDLPHKVIIAAEEVRQAFDLFEDEASQREFLAQIQWRLTLDFDALPAPVAHDMYFAADLLKPIKDEVFIDCGAFDGDTVRSFLRNQGTQFAAIISFEPDPLNLKRLRNCVEAFPDSVRQKITIHPYAVGARNEKVRFDVTGTASSMVGSGSLEVECIVLDEFLARQKPTWIKMDIEGAEVDALHGASHSIEEHSPILTVCAYHQQNHLWEIPLLIRRLSDQYQLFLRPHFLESWDVVCYAVPPARCRKNTP